MAECGEGKFLGNRWADPSDPSLVIIFDNAGYIAGVQSVLLKKDFVEDYPYDLSTQAAYTQDMWFEDEAWFTTAYFVDPAVICAEGRTEDQWNTIGTGDRLLIQLDSTENLVTIPLTQAEADTQPEWFDHFCFLGMGDHYMQFDYTPDQACDAPLPVQILYDGGVINGFVWQHVGHFPGDKWEHPDMKAISFIVDRPPTCLNELSVKPGLSTLHHYFYNHPQFTVCPLRSYSKMMLRK